MTQQTDISKMETTQTAVDWLFEQLVFKSDFEHLPNQYFLMSDKNIDKVFEQAKAMEKEQIINAMMYTLDEDGHTGDWKIKFVNDYYNKTFKS